MAWAVLSVPIYSKILGAGFGMTILFGVVAFYQIRDGLYKAHYTVHGEMALSVATSLAARLAPLVDDPPALAMDKSLDHAMDKFPEVGYIIVQDSMGHILSHGHTLPQEVPSDLLAGHRDSCAECHTALSADMLPRDLAEVPAKVKLSSGKLRAFSHPGGLVLDVEVPIADSTATVRVGVDDENIEREMVVVSRSLLRTLALCMAIGLSMALALAYVLVRPLHNLVRATYRISDEEFDARAEVFSGDEIGKLAMAFNEMAIGLETYRQEVQDKDRARVSLIGRIVQAQEDERKLVARELHDVMGQSLSNALLSIESQCKECDNYNPEHYHPIGDNIRGLIDDVRRLAWDMRPSILDDYGLDRALARYVEEMSKRVSFTIDYQCGFGSNGQRLPGHIEVSLYRIAQESVTNVIRHAQANEVSIVLLQYDNKVSLVVEDDGLGFDVLAAEHGTQLSLGLMGMKERAALVGGEFSIDSQPGKGTTVRVIIPGDEVEYDNPNPSS